MKLGELNVLLLFHNSTELISTQCSVKVAEGSLRLFQPFLNVGVSFNAAFSLLYTKYPMSDYVFLGDKCYTATTRPASAFFSFSVQELKALGFGDVELLVLRPAHLHLIPLIRTGSGGPAGAPSPPDHCLHFAGKVANCVHSRLLHFHKDNPFTLLILLLLLTYKGLLSESASCSLIFACKS